jgi:small GTP-binding protein
MPTFDESLKKMPARTQALLDAVWTQVPPEDRQTLLALLKGIPGDPRSFKTLIDLSIVQFHMAFGKQRNVAIVGPANVGKSTLYNQFVRSKADQAVVSALPGTTRVNQQADAGLFSVIDTPGADAVGEKEKFEALDAARQADFLVIVFDTIQGVKKSEQDLFFELEQLNKPYIVVLNKADLVKKELNSVRQQAARNLHLEPYQVIPIVAKEGKQIDQVVIAIAAVDPEIVASLGSAMPHFRWQLAWRAIVSAASLSAVIALAPMPILDFGPLIITQSIMVLAIARIYNYRVTLERARELVATFGLGFIGRMLFQELSKLGGLPGWFLAAIVASSTTIAMGYAASIWFERGDKLSQEKIKQITSDMTRYLIDRFKGKKQTRNRQSIKDQITATLEQSPLAVDQHNIESISEQHTGSKS